ncbi:MAG: peptidase, partial [Psychroserpens sp.]|nr:peptidase [Psychroserpens sp.]
MKKIILAGMLAVFCFACTQKPAEPTTYGNSITSDELKELLYTYASDEFEGRETGEKGQKMAVSFLKEKYVSMGIASAYGTDDYFQEVPLERQNLPEVSFVVNGNTMVNYEDFIPPRNVDVPQLNLTEIVYAGYGIDAKDNSDYDNLDVKDKYVFIKAGEPINEDSTYVTSGTKEKSQWTSGRRARKLKVDIAHEKGAKGVFIWDESANNYYSRTYKELAQGTYKMRVAQVSKPDDPYSFIINQRLAEQVVPDILTNDTPAVISTNIELTINK